MLFTAGLFCSYSERNTPGKMVKMVLLQMFLFFGCEEKSNCRKPGEVIKTITL